MCYRKYTTFPTLRWWLMWAGMTCMIDSISSFVHDIPSEWQFVITVAAPFVAAFVLLITNLTWRWYKIHNPFKVTYLIPRENYGEVLFHGAENEEKTPKELTVGIGYYRVMHLIIPKREIDIGAIKLRFSGPNQNKPIQRGQDNPYWVEEIHSMSSQPSSNQYLNWEGEVYSFPDIVELPLHLIKNVPLYIGNGVKTTGSWHGEIILVFPVYKWKTIEKRLKFHVTSDKDDIPFLEGERTSGKHKEVHEREESKQKAI